MSDDYFLVNEKVSNIEARLLIVDDNEDIHVDYEKVLKKENEEQVQNAGDDFITVALGYSIDDGKDEFDQFPFKSLTLDFADISEVAVEKVHKAYEENKPYHIIYIDIKMPPGDNGIITIKKIWEHYPEQQFVICTAYSDFNYAKINEALGVRKPNIFMVKKAFDPDSLKLMTQSLIIQDEMNRKYLNSGTMNNVTKK